jgi:HD-GYP domain-containing protein (c-di-GMP phosphodiesterase class II)
MLEKELEFLTDIMTAVSGCKLYSEEHPEVMHFCEKAIGVMEDLYSDDSLSLTVLGGSLIFNDAPFKEKSIHAYNLLRRMRRKGIQKILIRKGVTKEELRSFIADMASTDRPPGAYQHISTGVVEVRLRTDEAGSQAAMDMNLEKVKEVYGGISRFKEMDMVGLEDIVLSFVSTLKKEADVLRMISPVKSYSEYTYTHITNVSVLSIFQAESLGLDREMLHDVGIAGLLHDVGKTLIPKEILEKPEKLSESEWYEMKKHPVLGAMYLSTLPDVPGLAVIAAYEHHMKFDGKGYPPPKRLIRRQHLISQIIAISDFFDALRTERSYRKALDIKVILGLMGEGAGKDFNPVLVENFIQALKRINAV